MEQKILFATWGYCLRDLDGLILSLLLVDIGAFMPFSY